MDTYEKTNIDESKLDRRSFLMRHGVIGAAARVSAEARRDVLRNSTVAATAPAAQAMNVQRPSLFCMDHLSSMPVERPRSTMMLRRIALQRPNSQARWPEASFRNVRGRIVRPGTQLTCPARSSSSR